MSRFPDSRAATDRSQGPAPVRFPFPRERPPLPLPEPDVRPRRSPPAPEPLRRHRVRPLRESAHDRHRGRRNDRRFDDTRTRAQREQAVLDLLGTYRVISRRRLVDVGFDGHPFAASNTLASLESRGQVAHSLVSRGPHGYQVFYLTPHGRDLVAQRRRRRSADGDDEDDGQRFWHGPGDLRALAHDHHVFDAVVADTADDRRAGAGLRRVRLEPELRGLLAVAGDLGGRSGGPSGALDARREAAREIGLRVFESGVPLPDALVEVEHPDGRVEVRAIEVATSSYSFVQTRAKLAAGFRVYRAGAGSERRPRGTRDPDREYALSWGGR